MTLNEMIDQLINLRDNHNAGDWKVNIPIIYRFGYVYRGNGMEEMNPADINANYELKSVDISCHEEIK